MKIIYHHRIASNDGQLIHLQAISKQLKLLGHEVRIVGPNISIDSKMGDGKKWVRFLKMAIPKTIYEVAELAYNIYDLIFLSLIVIIFRPDAIYERSNLYLIAGVWVSRIFGVPLLLEVNAPLFAERKKYNGLALPSIAEWSEFYVWKNANFVLPVSYVLAEIVRSKINRENIVVIPNGIDPHDLEITIPSAKLLGDLKLEGQDIIGFVGFVREWHKLDRIIDYIADKGDNRLCLLVVGEGPDCERLLAYSMYRNIAHQIKFVGVVQRTEIASYINIFRVAVQSAVTSYASPLKVFEYLYLGCTIVAPDSPNVREILEHEENAFLFRDSAESLYESLDNALESSLSDAIRRSAKLTIERKGFLWKENAKKIANLILNSK